MKNLAIIILLIGSMHDIFSQELLFKTKIYFEDAVGNRDTITIGFDTTANSKYNPHLGEIDLKSSFDSIFEVRASHGHDYLNTSMILSKKIIGFSELAWPINCYSGEPINIFINAKYQPIKMYWNRADFLKSKCTYGSFIHYNFLYEIVDPNAIIFDPEFEYQCLGNHDSTYIYIGKEYVQDEGNLDEIPYSTVINNDTIYGFQLIPDASANESPCFVTSTSDTNSYFADIFIHPNPTNSIVNIIKGKAEFINVFNIQGKMIDVQYDDNRLDLSNQKNGIYFIRLKNGNGYLTKKVVKIE